MKPIYFMLLLLSFDLFAREIETKKQPVKVYEAADLKSKVLQTLSVGEAMECRDRVGAFWEVHLSNGNWAYVEFDQVRLKKGNKVASQLQIMKDNLQGQGKVGGDPAIYRTRTSIVGAKSFRDSTDLHSVDNSPPNFRLLYLLESFKVPKADIEDFPDELKKELKR